ICLRLLVRCVLSIHRSSSSMGGTVQSWNQRWPKRGNAIILTRQIPAHRPVSLALCRLLGLRLGIILWWRERGLPRQGLVDLQSNVAPFRNQTNGGADSGLGREALARIMFAVRRSLKEAAP